MLDYVAKNADRYSTTYGNVSSATIGAIQRSLLSLADEGGEEFFGEPAFDIYDLMLTEGGRGVMSVLAADELMLRPKLYSTFLMWLLTSIYEKMPEVGEVELPRMVFFFDEAHMLPILHSRPSARFWSWVRVRRWCRFWMRRVHPRWWSVRRFSFR